MYLSLETEALRTPSSVVFIGRGKKKSQAASEKTTRVIKGSVFCIRVGPSNLLAPFPYVEVVARECQCWMEQLPCHTPRDINLLLMKQEQVFLRAFRIL